MSDGFELDFGSDSIRWQRLLDEIGKGNVIPIIGPDLLVAPRIVKGEDGRERTENLHQQLITYLASHTGVTSHPRTFSQLVYNQNYKQMVRDDIDRIYNLIHQILSNADRIPEIDITPSELLVNLLSTKCFPFVITTSFTPVVEQVMSNVWGKVNVLNYNGDPQTSDDIASLDVLKQPTVYYMFGKYSNTASKYAVTDSDIMRFCAKWLKELEPRNLKEILKKKYVLFLGNNYSDWLFRFVWYGLRWSTNVMKTDVVVNDKAEDSLKGFLKRLDAFFQDDPSEVISKIVTDMGSRQQVPQSAYKNDVFISYSRTDSDVAARLYNALTASGLKVWFDLQSIEKAADWKQALENGIRHARLFVPVLTKNIEKESLIPHEYRAEWKYAATLSARMGGRTFIVPLVEQGFDFYNPLTDIPKEFSDKNATWFNGGDNVDMTEITDVLIHEIEKLKELERNMNR